MFRTILTILTVVILTTIEGILAIIAGIFNPYSKLVTLIATTWAKSILFISGAKVEVNGFENINSNRSYVFIGNHQSSFDILAIFVALPIVVRFLAKKELFKIPIFGWALRAVGMIKIDRRNHQQSVLSINSAIEKMKKGVSIIVFPEGTRSEDGNLGKFKKGGFVIAIKGGIPVAPVSISGSNQILKKHSWRITPGKIKVTIGVPIDTKDFNYNQRDELIKNTRNTIVNNME